jgi:hypothetical protein
MKAIPARSNDHTIPAKPFMWRNWLVAVALLFSACAGTRQERRPAAATPEQVLRHCLTELDGLVNRHRDALGKVTRIYDVVRTATLEQRITFAVLDSTAFSDGALRGGALFMAKKSGRREGTIVINRALLAKYRQNRSIIHSVLIHEMHHAHDYLQSGDHFLRYAGDKQHYEHILYETDAYISEGIFINTCLKPNGYRLTDFEHFLSNCVEKKEVGLAMMYLQSCNSDVIVELVSRMRSPDSYTETISRFIDFFDKLAVYIAKMKTEDAPDYSRYQAAVVIGTCVVYGPSLFFDTVNAKQYKGGPGRMITLRHHPGFHAAHERLRVLYNSVLPWFKQGEEIKKRLLAFADGT